MNSRRCQDLVVKTKGPRTESSARVLRAIHWIRYSFGIFLGVVAILLVTSSPAYAYIDPGLGSLMWQLLFAGFVGGMFYVRKIRNWIVAMIRRKDK